MVLGQDPAGGGQACQVFREHSAELLPVYLTEVMSGGIDCLWDL